MIIYEKHPISAAEASRLKTWLVSSEAQLFKDCLTAMQNKFFVDSINIKCRPAETMEDKDKVENLSSAEETKGRAMHWLITEFEKLSDPEIGFFRLKINT